MLRDLGHPRGAAGMEVAGDPVARAVGKVQGLRLPCQFGREADHTRLVADGVLRPDQRHDQRLRARKVADKIHLHHRLDIRGKRDSLCRLLRHVGLGKCPQRDQHLGLRLAQDGGDLLHIQQRVDRVHDTRDLPAQIGQHRLVAVGQEIGDHVILSDPERAEEVRRLASLFKQCLPGQRLLLRRRVRQKLIAHRRARGMSRRGSREHRIGRHRQIALGPGVFRFDRVAIRHRGIGHATPSPLGPFPLPAGLDHHWQTMWKLLPDRSSLTLQNGDGRFRRPAGRNRGRTGSTAVRPAQSPRACATADCRARPA